MSEHATYYPDGGSAHSPTPTEPYDPVLRDEFDGVAHDPAAAVDDLDQTVSDPPTQAEGQAISDKVDELLAALRASGQLTDDS